MALSDTREGNELNKATLVYANPQALTLAACLTTLQRWFLNTTHTKAKVDASTENTIRAEAAGIRVRIDVVYRDMAVAAATFWGEEMPCAAEAEAADDATDAGALFLVRVNAVDPAQQSVADEALMSLGAALTRRARPDAVGILCTENWLTGDAFMLGQESIRPSRPYRPENCAHTRRPSRNTRRVTHMPLATTGVSTRRRLPCQTRRQIALHETGLRDAFRVEDPQMVKAMAEREAIRLDARDRGGVKAWTMTATCTIVAPPIGVALACANLAQGASLRTASHMLALSGLFITLGAQSSLAQIISGAAF